MKWPVQSKCMEYYGDPRKADWTTANLVKVQCPWDLYFDGKKTDGGISAHKKCAASLDRVLNAIWVRLGKSQAEIDRIGMSKFSGSYNLRNIRGGKTLSMHSYGCAVDFDAANNWLGDTTPAMDRRVIEEFEREGWEWGGHWSRPDGMHFQAAWTRASPPRLGLLTAKPNITVKEMTSVSKKASFLDWVRKGAQAIGAASAGVFTADNLGLFSGWFSTFAGLGKFALVAGVCILGYWLIANVVLHYMQEDHNSGRWTPSGETVEEPSNV